MRGPMTPSEADEVARGLPSQWSLQLSSDHPPAGPLGQGRRLWNVIAPDGSHRGQMLLADADA